jgi:phage N-6-adenine-methyltransferase
MESSPLQNGAAPHNETVTQLAIVTGVNKGGRTRKYDTNAERQRAFRQRQRDARRVKALSVHFSRETVLWSTPQAFFDTLNAEFGFTCDVCAMPDNAKCAAFYSPQQDGLRQRWEGVCYCNPPYGAEIALWVQKAYESSLWGTTVVCLLPARVDTRWWQRYIEPLPKADVRNLPGRQRFSESKNSAPFPSAVVIFRPASQ